MMTYYTLLLSIFGVLFGCYLLWLFYQRLQRRALERYLENASLSAEQRSYLEHIPLYRALSPDEHEKAQRYLLRFLLTREFRGVRLDVTEEMRTVVAFYAAVILLNKDEMWLDHIRTIWLYEGGFLAEEQFDHGGIVSSGMFELDGQSSHDAVVLSWEDARREACEGGPYNVIIHEFAHALDFASGTADGVPPLHMEDANAWVTAFDREFDALLDVVEHDAPLGLYEPFGAYAAENEAEFFAIASELFYGRPMWMKEHFSTLFGLLERFYGVDPTHWGIETDITAALKE